MCKLAFPCIAENFVIKCRKGGCPMKRFFKNSILFLLVTVFLFSLCACQAPETPDITPPEPVPQPQPKPEPEPEPEPEPQPPKLGWMVIGGNRYYYATEDVMSTGWTEMDGTT